MTTESMTAFEQQIASQGLFSKQNEKTFVDKILARDDAQLARELIRKPKLTRSELLELLYQLTSNEAKLLNYSEWDRYVILKYFTWIRDFIKIAEGLYDYQEDLRNMERKCFKCGKFVILHESMDLSTAKKCECEIAVFKFVLSDRTKKLLYNNERLVEHNAKFLIDLYFNIGRTSLSIGATGFLEFIRQKFEFSYPDKQQMKPDEGKTFMGIKIGGSK